MTAAILDKPAASRAAAGPSLGDIVLVRLACGPAGAKVADVAADLAPLAAQRMAQAAWRARIEREIEVLVETRHAVRGAGARFEATPAGVARATGFLGIKGPVPASWIEVRDVRLVARALGLQREPAKRLKALATPEGLRTAVVERAYQLKLKGVPTPSRLRTALAGVALQRAFGNQIAADVSSKRGLSAKAGRLLAAQLARKPRDFGTDGRLVAALAAEHLGISRSDFDSLRTALLRRFIGSGGEVQLPKPKRVERTVPTPTRAQPTPQDAVPATVASGRPDLNGFAEEVRRQAAMRARGWAGDRKAYISDVWRLVREGRTEWGLSEIEFKCMLAEAHRLGKIALAHADLKDGHSMQDLKDSAIAYKNTVFHFIRIDA